MPFAVCVILRKKATSFWKVQRFILSSILFTPRHACAPSALKVPVKKRDCMGVMAVRGTLSHWINYFFGEGRGRGEIAHLKDFKKRGKKKIFGGSDHVEKWGRLENIPISPLTIKK